MASPEKKPPNKIASAYVATSYGPQKRCTDPVVLERREKEVQKAKERDVYAAYMKMMPKNKRIAGRDPTTPDKEIECSRRSWDAQLRNWKRQMYAACGMTLAPEEKAERDRAELEKKLKLAALKPGAVKKEWRRPKVTASWASAEQHPTLVTSTSATSAPYDMDWIRSINQARTMNGYNQQASSYFPPTPAAAPIPAYQNRDDWLNYRPTPSAQSNLQGPLGDSWMERLLPTGPLMNGFTSEQSNYGYGAPSSSFPSMSAPSMPPPPTDLGIFGESWIQPTKPAISSMNGFGDGRSNYGQDPAMSQYLQGYSKMEDSSREEEGRRTRVWDLSSARLARKKTTPTPPPRPAPPPPPPPKPFLEDDWSVRLANLPREPLPDFASDTWFMNSSKNIWSN